MPDNKPQPRTTKRKRAKATAKAKATTAAKRKAGTARKAATASKRKAGTARKAASSTTSKAGTATKRKAGTKAKRKTSARTATKANASAAARTGTTGSRARRPPRGRSAGLPHELLKSIEDGQRAAADAVRKFVETVDNALPLRGESAAKRQEVVESALEMTERLVQTQFDVLRRVMRSAGRTFGDSVKRS
jgi:flagellar capping protein FliD